MPQFIKMGLGGTGYLGLQEKTQRARRRYKARRSVLPGFPVESKFKSIEDVRDYFSGDTIICLLCGKNYKNLGIHITKIHRMSLDDYREKYNIPWSYGLACKSTKTLQAQSIAKRVSEGFNIPAAKIGEIRMPESSKHRTCPFKKEISLQNIQKAQKANKDRYLNP